MSTATPNLRECKAEAIRLRDDERMGYVAIAHRLGVGRTTIWRWINPDAHREQRRRPPPRRKGCTWETAQWADGALLHAWIYANVENHRIPACGALDAIRHWADFEGVSFWVVDRAFTKLNLHVSQLPVEVWIG